MSQFEPVLMLHWAARLSGDQTIACQQQDVAYFTVAHKIYCPLIYQVLETNMAGTAQECRFPWLFFFEAIDA